MYILLIAIIIIYFSVGFFLSYKTEKKYLISKKNT